MFNINITVARTQKGAYKVLYIGEKLEPADQALKEADDDFAEVTVFHLPIGMKFRYPAQEAQMQAARDEDAEARRLASVSKNRRLAAQLQEESKRQAEEATKLLADADATEKALGKAATPKK